MTTDVRSTGLDAATATSPIGRVFVLGRPDLKGHHRVFLSGSLWRITDGHYGPGDRVQVIGVDQDRLLVQTA